MCSRRDETSSFFGIPFSFVSEVSKYFMFVVGSALSFPLLTASPIATETDLITELIVFFEFFPFFY